LRRKGMSVIVDLEESIKTLVRELEKERVLDQYYNFLKEFKNRRSITYRESLKLGYWPMLLRLMRLGLIRKVKTKVRTVYVFTEETQKLLDLVEEEINKYDRLVKPKPLVMSNMEWVIRTLIKLWEEGITQFNKGLFFKKFYELIEELEMKGYIFTKPKLVSIDRCLRLAVELGYLTRRGSKQKPIYIINESEILSILPREEIDKR